MYVVWVYVTINGQPPFNTLVWGLLKLTPIQINIRGQSLVDTSPNLSQACEIFWPYE